MEIKNKNNINPKVKILEKELFKLLKPKHFLFYIKMMLIKKKLKNGNSCNRIFLESLRRYIYIFKAVELRRKN